MYDISYINIFFTYQDYFVNLNDILDINSKKSYQ